MSFKIYNMRFPQFVNRLESFIERTIDHYPDAKDFIMADAEGFWNRLASAIKKYFVWDKKTGECFKMKIQNPTCETLTSIRFLRQICKINSWSCFRDSSSFERGKCLIENEILATHFIVTLFKDQKCLMQQTSFHW